MTELASQTLAAVAREINGSLSEARTALEAHVEQPANPALLERCRYELHQVQGVLRLLEIYGAALLAEEMEQVALYLISLGAERKNQAEALDALMRAMVQLPGYLERVLAGGRDLALVLLPLLNDLRAVRGSALLSEGTLLLLNLKSDRQAQPSSPVPGEPAMTLAQWARRLRSRFQTGLIGWIRSERAEHNLEIIASVAERLEQRAQAQAVFQLWWVVGALIEALRENGVESSISVKRLLGLADREIKRLYEQGETQYAQHPPVELLNNLLYYIARATSGGPRVTAVRNSFRLDELLPVDESVEQERENLSAPSVKLMHTVAAAIREDLSKVKDVLDIYVRRGGGAAEELAPQVVLLKKIGDTLGVLGIGELRARVQEAIHRLESMVSGQEPSGEAELVQVAASLISVEDHLDEQLVGMILPRKRASDAESEAVDHDFQQVQGAVLRECVINLARVKEYIAQNVRGTLDTAGFDNWPELMRGIKAGLLMLGKTRAVEIIEDLSLHLRPVMQPGGIPLAPEYLDRLADAIVSVEYYIETLQAGRSDPWYMLDNARSCIEALRQIPERAPPTIAPLAGAAAGRAVPLGADQLGAAPTATQRIEPAAIERIVTAPPVLAAAATPSPWTETTPDPELISLFVEEATEEVEKIHQLLPMWDRNPLDGDALLSVRRSFHTLKGSGRMVNARHVSEFAWAIENLLNRLIEGTLQRSPAVLEILRSADKLLPRLVSELAAGHPGRTDVSDVVARAHACASGREPVGGAIAIAHEEALGAPPETASVAPGPAATPRTAVASEPPEPAVTRGEEAERERALGHAAASAPAGADPALREIYARETAMHVIEVRAWIEREGSLRPPHVLPESVYRACHTLSGSSRMAEARQGIRLAEPLDHWLRKSFDSGMGLDDSDLLLLSDCMTAMETVTRHLDEPTGFFVVHDTLRARIARAEHELDRRIVEEAELAARSGVSLPALRAAEDGTELDPEVAAIFSEEAVELLDAAESALAAWNGSPDDAHFAAALRRPLHTLKGGARMAGVTPMAELAHELESLITRIESDAGSSSWIDESARGIAQEALDELARMREAVAAGRAAQGAPAVIGRIHAFAMPSVAPASRAASVPQARQAPQAPQAPAPPAPRAAPDARAAPSAIAPPAAMLVPASKAPEAPAIRIRSEAAAIEPPEAPAIARSEPPAVERAAVPSAPFSAAEALEQRAVAAAAAFAPSAQPPEISSLVLERVHEPAAPAPLPPGREPVAGERAEMARVNAELLDQLLNHAGEVSIARARLEQQLGSIEFNLGELSRTVTRLKEQLRKLEIETEAQILHRHADEPGHRAHFDPLELDRYSSIQQFSRALAESASDVGSIQGLLENLIGEAQNLLQQQSRTVTELQNGLMRTRMVSFQRHVQRLARIVRQAATESGKRAELVIDGAAGEFDRQVLERMLPPFEHLLRNAVIHGIESPEARHAAGKDEVGSVTLSLRREGSEVIVEVGDDGAGMDLNAIRAKGLALGLIRAEQQLSDEDVMQLVLEPGFSTARSLTQQAGRGVGMDVVAVEVKKLGGALHMESTAGRGTRFTIRLPFTLAISHALVVRAGEEYYALPLPTIEGVVRLPRDEVGTHLRADSSSFVHGGQKYRMQPLAIYVGLEASPLPDKDVMVPVVLVRAGEHSTGLVVDELVGSREIVVKAVGPQITGIRGISGATILSDGRIAIILDISALVRAEWRGRGVPSAAREKVDRRTFVMVVDDSITVRRVTQRLLERNGMRVVTARDGMDAVGLLAEYIPDIMLLDIEMPRMDGYEVAAHVRNDPRLRDVPIIMVTSRVGEKHRARAIELGVDDYLGKPYQDSQLIEAITSLVAQRRGGQRALGAAR
jgi:chemosensory pili system protein ChpA (sensor histidine kinase/response regulator)